MRQPSGPPRLIEYLEALWKRRLLILIVSGLCGLIPVLNKVMGYHDIVFFNVSMQVEHNFSEDKIVGAIRSDSIYKEFDKAISAWRVKGDVKPEFSIEILSTNRFKVNCVVVSQATGVQYLDHFMRVIRERYQSYNEYHKNKVKDKIAFIAEKMAKVQTQLILLLDNQLNLMRFGCSDPSKLRDFIEPEKKFDAARADRQATKMAVPEDNASEGLPDNPHPAIPLDMQIANNESVFLKQLEKRALQERLRLELLVTDYKKNIHALENEMDLKLVFSIVSPPVASPMVKRRPLFYQQIIVALATGVFLAVFLVVFLEYFSNEGIKEVTGGGQINGKPEKGTSPNGA